MTKNKVFKDNEAVGVESLFNSAGKKRERPGDTVEIKKEKSKLKS